MEVEAGSRGSERAAAPLLSRSSAPPPRFRPRARAQVYMPGQATQQACLHRLHRLSCHLPFFLYTFNNRPDLAEHLPHDSAQFLVLLGRDAGQIVDN